MAGSEQPPGHRRRLALVAGVLVAVATLSVGLAALLSQPDRWSAEASMLVLPREPTRDPDVLAGLYDTLSQGEVPATYAELLRTLATRTPEEVPLGEEQSVEVQVEVIPETAVIRVTATAGSPSVAEQAADAVVDGGRRYVSELGTPYGVRGIGSVTGSAERTGPSVPLLVGVLLGLAVVAGVAAAQAVRALGALLGRRRGVAAPAPAVAALAGRMGPVDSLFEPDEAAAPAPEATPTRIGSGGGRHSRRPDSERQAPARPAAVHPEPVPGPDVRNGAGATAPAAGGAECADPGVSSSDAGRGGGVRALAVVAGSTAQQAARQIGALVRRPARRETPR